jgi:predicted ATP-grasp superfamily ATP-dependent carboligase
MATTEAPIVDESAIEALVSQPGDAHAVAVINNDWAPTLAFAVSLGRRNVPLHFYGPGSGRWSRYCTARAACPPVNDANRFLPWLRSRVKAGEITRLAPTTDLIAYYLAVLRDEFPVEVRRAITPLSEIERCLIKTQFSTACENVGQLVPAQAAPDNLDAAVEAARTLGYPLIIKPKSHLVVGTSQRGQLVHDEAGLRRAYRAYPVASGQEQLAADYPELRWPFLQRYIPSARRCVYSISGIKDVETGMVSSLLTVKQSQWPPDIGVSTVQKVCNDQSILDAGLKTVDRLISRGIFELEVLLDGDKLVAIDLNPRAFGFIFLDMAVGNDLPWLWWQTTLGAAKPLPMPKEHFALECRFVVPYYFGRAIYKLFGPSVPNSPNSARVSRSWISMLGHRNDPLPMLLANIRLLRLLPHPGGLLRPFLAAARRSRRTQTP